jgi:hypothetical protein
MRELSHRGLRTVSLNPLAVTPALVLNYTLPPHCVHEPTGSDPGLMLNHAGAEPQPERMHDPGGGLLKAGY